MSNKDIFTIGECMQKSGVSIRTLRYYDSIDLLKPSDYTEGGHRLYSKEDLAKLQKIKSLQFLGFTLQDIKSMLQRNTASGSEIWKSLHEQKHIFEEKIHEITNVLSNLDHLMETIEGEETINIHIFCLMLQRLIFAEDTNKWFEDHFSKSTADELLNINKSDEIELDKRWSTLLTEINYLAFAGVGPSNKRSQLTIDSLMKLMNDTTKGNLDIIENKLSSSESIPFINPFSEREAEFLNEAMAIYQKENASK